MTLEECWNCTSRDGNWCRNEGKRIEEVEGCDK